MRGENPAQCFEQVVDVGVAGGKFPEVVTQLAELGGAVRRICAS